MKCLISFRTLVLLDRKISVMLGRPCATRDDEYAWNTSVCPLSLNQDRLDLDYPIACDDEYWDHPDPARAFKQPEGRPSRIDFLISVIKLTQAMGPGMSFLVSTAFSSFHSLSMMLTG